MNFEASNRNGRRWRRLALATTAAIGLAALGAGSASAATYTPITPYSGVGTTTAVLGINNAGFMTGDVVNADTSVSGILRDPAGVYTLFTTSDFDTFGRAINNANVITGYTTDSTGNLLLGHEFKRDPGGAITFLTNPTDSTFLLGIAQGINSSGEIVGDYRFNDGVHNFRHGYLLNGGSFTDLSQSADFRVKQNGRGINDSGTIVGWVLDNNTGFTQGFVDIAGAFTYINDPSVGNANTTFLEAINNNGLASGEWTDATGNNHPFLYNTATNAFTELHPPGGGTFDAFGINDLGEVVLTDNNGSGVNFLYNPTGVPEPGTWAMMLLGFAGVGYAARRRRLSLAATA
jgi:PEP-CTERM motif